MANLEQWVNLPKDAVHVEDEIKSEERLGALHFEAEFEKASLTHFKVKVSPRGNKAKYSRKEKKRNANFKIHTFSSQTNTAQKKIKLETDVRLPAAGGNKFLIKAKYRKTIVQSKTFVETRRKLYFQVIQMKGMKVTVKTLTSHLEDEYWTPAKRYYIKLKEIASKGDISGYPNFDEHQQGELPGLARGNYSNIKDPFCFAIILVDQMAASEKPKSKKTIVVDHKIPQVLVSTTKPIWKDLDKAGSPEEKWNFGGSFIESVSGKITTIDPQDITYVSKYLVKVKSASLPDGIKGTVELELKLVNRFRTGLSLGKNAICVATRAQWTQRDDGQMKSTLVHEAGHKIGMVPDGDDGGLDKQTTFYYKRGGHCNHGKDTCVMYGTIHAKRSNRFCSDCEDSVRRLDLDASKLSGFEPL